MPVARGRRTHTHTLTAASLLLTVLSARTVCIRRLGAICPYAVVYLRARWMVFCRVKTDPMASSGEEGPRRRDL